jgi:hypothetical protein
VANWSANKDKLAIDAYEHAESTGLPLTLGLVERRLDELRSHEPECACGLCTAATNVGAPGVLTWRSGGPAGFAATRRRAMR